MQDVLVFILKNIVTLPDDVAVTEETVDGSINYSVTVNPGDVGRVIGKEGKVIKAIRTVMRVIAIQKGVRVRVSVVSEGDEPTKAAPADEPVIEDSDSISIEV